MADAARDANSIPTLIGVSNADGKTPIRVYADPVTHRLLVTSSAAGNNFTDNEVVSGSGTTFTLASTPIANSEHIFANGQRLTPGGVDYTIAGAVITTVNSFVTGTVLADYRT